MIVNDSGPVTTEWRYEMARVIVLFAVHYDYESKKTGGRVVGNSMQYVDPAGGVRDGEYGCRPVDVRISDGVQRQLVGCPCLCDVVFGVRPGFGNRPDVTVESLTVLGAVDLLSLAASAG